MLPLPSDRKGRWNLPEQIFLTGGILRQTWALGFILLINNFLFCQEMITEERTGKVTYQSSQNTYAGFESTEGIKQNDTLFIKSGGQNIPALLVSFISSRSLAGPRLGKVPLKTGDELTAVVKMPVKKKTETIPLLNKDNSISAIQPKEVQSKAISHGIIISPNMLKGRFSIQSYSSFSNLSRSVNTQRWRYSLSSETKNIFDSGLNFSNYVTFSYNAHEWQKMKNNVGSAIRVYDLSLQYDINNSLHLKAGRYINPKISSISSIDGFQVEKSWSTFYGGLVVGSRPDFSDFGYNFKLFETGAYFGKSDTLLSGVMNNTLAVFNQTNDFKTDRRFFYFQHDNYVMNNLSFFLSSEMDLYSREKGMGQNTLSLTSLYLMSRYSPLDWLSISLSYDARKNVIYYETFKSFADSLFDKQTRQGIRGGISLRPMNYMYVGLDAGYRFEKGDTKPARNFSGYLSYSRIPWLDMAFSCNISNLTGGYVDGLLYGGSLTKDVFSGLLSASAGFRRVEYSFSGISDKLRQNILSADLSLLLMKNVFLITSYEGTFEPVNSSGRVLLEISTRF